MKKLIVILAIIWVGHSFGQNDSSIIKLSEIHSQTIIDIFYFIDELAIIVGNIEEKCINYSDLLEYKQECYNDSTTIKVNVNPDKNYNKDGFRTLIYYPPVWKDKWIHKQPTFTDFMNWLEKKYKK